MSAPTTPATIADDHPPVADLTNAEARILTARIRVGIRGCWSLISEAYDRSAWRSLGYSSWQAYTEGEFGNHVRLTQEDRVEVVEFLRASNMSVRAIAAAVGISKNTVTADLAQVSQIGTPEALHEAGMQAEAGTDPVVVEIFKDFTEGMEKSTTSAPEPNPAPPRPAKVTGIDGKAYSAKSKIQDKPRRGPLADSFRNAALRMVKASESLTRLTEDDRFPANRDKVAGRGNLELAYANLGAVLAALDGETGE